MKYTALPITLGGYRIGRTLGQGAMGAVYEATSTEAHDAGDAAPRRAIKVLFPVENPRSDIPQRFMAEGEMLLGVDHPNVVRVFAAGKEGPWSFIVMELCEGGSPVDWLARFGKMPPRMATQAALMLCDGLDAVHARGLVHRDVKPSNMLVTGDGVVKLADFGIARNVLADDGLTRTNAVLGTLGYMAPEQRRSTKYVDERADVYAAAATLHTLLTDRVEMDLFASSEHPEIFADVHPALVPVLKRGFAYNRADRQPSIAALAAELRAAFDLLPPDPPNTHILPVRVVRADNRPGDASPTTAPTEEFVVPRVKTVLVVEDDDMLLRLAEFVLTDMMHMRVLKAADGAQALRVSDAHDGYIDAVLTDLVMPGQHGAQVATALRRSRPGLRVVYMSAHTLSRLMELGMEPVGGALLQKPFTPQGLVSAIEKALQ